MKKRNLVCMSVIILIFVFSLICGTYLLKNLNSSLISFNRGKFASSKIEDYNLFFPNISKRNNPQDLLVMVFLYDDYTNHNNKTDYIFNMTDEEIEIKYYNEIFGSGNVEQQTWSVNDFYKENSNGKFYFNPILVDNNTTGIYTIKFNKTYDMNSFSSDIKQGFKNLVDKGLKIDGFKSKATSGITQTKHVLCIFPTIGVEHVGSYFLTDDLHSNVAVTQYGSVLSTITHELGHSLEMPDIYNQGTIASLMGDTTLFSQIKDTRYPFSSNNYTIPAHIDPLHKISLGWEDYELIDESKTVRLYPTTSSLYNPVIVPTDDSNQYFIIENRKATSFESQITLYTSRGDVDDPEEAGSSNYEGINIWRVDKLGYNDLINGTNRKGNFVIGVLKYQMENILPKKYISTTDKTDKTKKATNIDITYISSNDDGSINVNIDIFEESDISYTVRYNSNDDTYNCIQKKYLYTQNVIFPSTLFETNGRKFLGWNTKPDGSGDFYDADSVVFGLFDGTNEVIDLYAQWEETYPYIINKYSVDETNKYIDLIQVNTTVDEFKKNITLNNGFTVDVEYKDIDGKKILYTGGKTRIYKYGELYVEYTNIVIGDVNGNGKIDIIDYIRIMKDIMGTKLFGVYMKAADVNQNVEIDIIDYIRIIKMIMEEN